ncbi:trans-aconitate 2-methyltransferase [Granulicella sp. S156]|uniref:trans-aconitate 2-methyltransferase n=1 Tax=Granulicella sp. S156 TaxID=1747224 RepID=UPI00131AAE05|nr:trans-aconitate 2-methyltransferase [Granulicella sp. S156]
MSWSAVQYTKFEEERNRPIRDLLNQIPTTTALNALDLGCGPGNSTELLSQRFPNAIVTGIDSSDDMLEAARTRLPGIRFEKDDIALLHTVTSSSDVIFANASLQWVPDHALLLKTLTSRLSPGGSLAVQIPDNLDEPAHRLMREVASSGPWAERLIDASNAREDRHTADWYYTALHDHMPAINIWRTTYYHPLAGGAAAIVEWFKGSGLRPYLAPLNEADRALFLTQYQAAIAQAYPSLPDGTVLLPFPRLFFVATR